MLQDAVQGINSGRPVQSSREELYSCVESLCKHGAVSMLNTRLVSLMESAVEGRVATMHDGTPVRDDYY